MDSSFSKYIACLGFVVTCLIAVPLLLNSYMLYRSGEYLTGENIYRIQADKNSFNVYGSAISDNVTGIKLHAFFQKKPDIVVLGSSRTLQFRENFFSKSFYNLGLMVGSVSDLEKISDGILAASPKILILGADFWWFHEDQEHVEARHKKEPQKFLAMIKDSTAPLQWLNEGGITYSDYKKLLFFEIPKHIGVRGKLRQSGIAPDGSYYYTDRIIGKHSNNREMFFETLERIDGNKDQFVTGDVASVILVDRFNAVLKKLKERNIEVVVFFPPLAPLVLDAMKKKPYKYVDHLRHLFKERNIKYYDFMDPVTLGEPSNCEFIDGFHGGDILYAKITQYIANDNKLYSQFVNKSYLNQIIENYHGFAMIPDDRILQSSEVDFLKLGCSKIQRDASPP